MGWLRWFAHHLGGAVCRGHAQYPAFAPDNLFLLFRLFKTGSWDFWSLCIFWVQNLPQLYLPAVIFSPIQFLCICRSRRGVSRGSIAALQQRVPVPASLNLMAPVKTFGAKNVRGLASEAEWALLESPGDPGGS